MRYIFDWIKRHKVKTLSMLFTAILISIGTAHNFFEEHKDISKSTEQIINPPTSKEADLRDVSKKLTVILEDLNELKQRVDRKMVVNNRRILFGINEVELERWEISVSGKNTLHLVEGDKVLVVNALSPQQQSAQFTVRFVRKNEKEDMPEMYINRVAAEFFGVVNPEVIGVFELTIQKID